MVRIATRVYTQEDIELDDGTEVTLKPLVINKLIRFMERWDDVLTIDDEYESMRIFIDVCGIALESHYQKTGKFERLKGSKLDLPEDADEDAEIPVLSNEYRQYLGDTLEMDSIYKIIEICGGIKLNDPKLMERALANLAEAGTN